jgi:outer membrane biosynthesis protein TonB
METPKESKKKVTYAVLASVVFHILLLLFLGFWLDLKASQPPIKPPEQQPVEITILPEEKPTIAVAPTPPPERETIRADHFQDAATPPPDAAFDSDRDTAKGGNKAGTGAKDMPNITGRASGEIVLEDQDVILNGKMNASSSSDESKEKPTPTPQPSPLVQATPQPTVQPTPTPEPTPDNTVALGRAAPTPAPPALPTPQPPGGGGQYQPQRRATRIEGSLSNSGRPSIATRGTPLGRYLRQVENAIGSRWYFYIKRDAAFVSPGMFRIIFTIDRAGKVGNLRVLSNTSNEGFASTCTQSIMDAELPSIPEEVASTLYTQRLELPFTFTIN